MNHQLAGFFQRAVALIVDIFILELLGQAVMIPLERGLGIRVDEALEQLLSGRMGWAEGMVFFTIYSTLLFLLWIGYFTIFTGLAGQTPGKKAMRIRVVRMDGSSPDMTCAGIRFLGFTLSASVFFLGCLWALFDANRQTWHDKMARTLVVKNDIYKP